VKLTWPQAVAAAVVVIAVALALSPLGRDERGDANRSQLAGIAAVDRLARPHAASGYRITSWADCLLYPVGADPYALELCYDAHGRGIEAIDRRLRTHTRISSVRYDPSLSTTNRSPARLFQLLRSMGAIPEATRFTGLVPLAPSLSLARSLAPGDTGPILVRPGRQ
jgi:hypothetical protein